MDDDDTPSENGMRRSRLLALVIPLLLLCGCTLLGYVESEHPSLRVPAEWEPHAATWIQWPGRWEAAMRPAFARIIDVIQDYEPLQLLVSSSAQLTEARQYVEDAGTSLTNITWHVVPIDNSWMRDNGPIYVRDGSQLLIQDWGFDAWGGNFGQDVPFNHDDDIPTWVANQTGIALEDRGSYILERGNLESNGQGLLILNWDCQDDRNPGMTQTEHETILRTALGATQILWAYGHDPLDGTIGHIDGTARFVDAETILIRTSDWGHETEEQLAAACIAAGLQVIRYDGDPNWLIGNGFVLAMSKGDSQDVARQHQLEQLFPNRAVHMIDARSISDAGGGIHCVTNDQPL